MHCIKALPLIVAALAACGPTGGGHEPSLATIEPWPFTVNEVTLSCEPADAPDDASAEAAATLRSRGSRVFVTTSDGRRFAVNGTARSQAPLMRDIQAAPDLSPLIQRGLALCEGGQSGSERLTAPQRTSPAASSATPPTFTFEPAGFGRGRLATAEPEQAINGVRPTLIGF